MLGKPWQDIISFWTFTASGRLRWELPFCVWRDALIMLLSSLDCNLAHSTHVLRPANARQRPACGTHIAASDHHHHDSSLF